MQGLDLSKLSTSDLKALQKNNLSGVSTEGLKYLQTLSPGQGQTSEPQQSPQQAAPDNRSWLQKAGSYVDSAARGAVQPFIDTALGVENGITKGLGKLTGQNLPGVGTLDVSSNVEHPTVATLAGIGSSFAMPMLKPLQAVGAVGKIAKLGDLAATGAAYSAADTLGRGEDESLLSNAFWGAALPVGIHSAIKFPLSATKGLANKIVSGLDKASQREGSGVKTPEQLQKILPDLKDVPVPLQYATNAGNENIGRIAKESSSIPFSGAAHSAQEAVSKTDDLAKALYHSIGGHLAPEEANPMIHGAIKAAEKRVSDKNGKMYSDLAEAGDAAGVKGSINNVQQKAAEILKDYNDSAIKEAHPLHQESFFRSLLGSLEKGFLPNMDKEYMMGEAAPVHGLMDVIKTQQGIGRYLGRVKGQQGKEAVTGAAKDLYKLAGKDLDQVIDSSGNSNLKSMLTNAKEDYKTNVLPYREGNIKKTLQKTDTANIADVLMNPNNKGSTILSHLTPHEKDIVLSQSLKPAVEARLDNSEFDTTPHKLLTKFADLKKKNPTAFNQLVSPEVQKSFESLGNLHETTKGLRSVAKKPETGVQLKPLLYGAGLGAIGKSAGMLAGMSNPASIALGPAAAYGNRAFQKLLRDPKLLEAYAAGKGKGRENALNELFGGKKSNAIRKTAGVFSNPAAIATLLTANGGEE